MRISDWSSDVCSSDLFNQQSIGVNGAGIVERRTERQIVALEPAHAGPRIGAKFRGRQDGRFARKPGRGTPSKRASKCLFELHDGGERERTPAGKSLLKRRNAEPGCVGQPLARPPEARQLFAHRGGDLFARAAIQISLHRRDSYHNRAMLPHISAQMFTGADKSIRASTVADEHCGSLSRSEEKTSALQSLMH